MSSEQNGHRTDCADARADLCLCYSHMHKAGFLMTELMYKGRVTVFYIQNYSATNEQPGTVLTEF